MKRIEKEMTPEMNIPGEWVVYKSDMKAKNYFMLEDEIIEIIMEELSPYLYRTKTLQEVTQIIQNRIQMIVQEMV